MSLPWPGQHRMREEQRLLVNNKFLHPKFVALLVKRINAASLVVPAHLKHPQDKTWPGRKTHSVVLLVKIDPQA